MAASLAQVSQQERLPQPTLPGNVQNVSGRPLMEVGGENLDYVMPVDEEVKGTRNGWGLRGRGWQAQD